MTISHLSRKSVSNFRRPFSKATLLMMAVAPAALLFSSGHASAVTTDTWDGGGADNNWKTAANWVSGSAPLPGDILVFDGSSRFTPNNNFSGNTPFDGITFASTAAGPFTLTGSTVDLNGNITDDTAAFTNTISLGLALQSTTNISVASFAALSITSNISGTGFGINETGSGILTLSGNNTFSGPVSVGSGATLSINTDSNLGTDTGASALTLTGGSTLKINASTALSATGGIQLIGPTASTISIAAINSSSQVVDTYNGSITDGGTVGALTKIGFGTLALGGSSTYTGATTIANGEINLDFSQTTAPTTNILYHGVTPGALTLGGTPAGLGNNSLDELVVTGKSGCTTSQTFASTTFQFGDAIVQSINNGGTADLNLGAISDNPGGTVIFVPSTTGCTTTFSTTTTVTNTAGILGGWATIGNLNTSALAAPAATGYPSVTLAMGTTWATVNGSGQIVGYTAYTDYNARIGTDTGPIIAAGALHPNVNANTNLKFDATTASNLNITVDANNAGTTTNINTIAFNSSSTFPMLTIGVANTLRLGQYGGIFKQDTLATNQALLYIGGHGSTQSGNGVAADGVSDQDEGILTAGPATGGPGQIVVTANNGSSESAGTIIFEAQITDNPAGGAVSLIKTGPNSMKLGGHNTYSGGTYILQGRVQLTGTELTGNISSTQAAEGFVPAVGSGNNTAQASQLSNPDGFGTGPVYIFPGAQVFPSGINGANGIIPNNFFFAGSGFAAENDGAFRLGAGITLTGTMTLIGNGMIGGAGQAFIAGQITGNYTLDLGSATTINANLVLSNGNTTTAAAGTVSGLVSTNNWTGNTTINGASGRTNFIFLGGNEEIPSGVGYGSLIMNGGGTTFLGLNGYNQSLNGLISGNTTGLYVSNASSNTTVVVHAGNSTLTVGGNNQTASFGGIVADTSPGYVSAGTLSLVKIGTGIQTLGGANTYSGTTTINNGALSITGSLNTASTVTVNTSATASGALYGGTSATPAQVGSVVLANATGAHLAVVNPGALGTGSTGTLNMTSLSVGTNDQLQFDLNGPGAADVINVSGALTFSGASSIAPTSITAGTYTVLNASSITGALPTLLNSGTTRLNFAYDPTSYNGTAGTSIVIDVSGSPAIITWSGASDGTTWDLHTTPNWTSTAPTNPNLYFDADNVNFTDSGIANNNISLGGNVQPGSITVSNNTGNYVISGGGSIGGAGTLAKTGNGTLTLATNNTFSGGTISSAGTLNINNNGALGTGNFTLNGGSIDNTSGQAVVVSGNIPVTLNADINFIGTGNLDLGAGAFTQGNLANGANRTITVGGSTLSIEGIIPDSPNGNNGLTKAGVGTLSLNGVNTFSGPVFINAGTLLTGNFGALGINTTSGTTIASGATLDISAISGANVANGFGAMPFTIAGTGVGGAGVIVNNGASQQNAFQSISLSADATIGGTGRFDIRGGTPLLSLNNHTLTKTGTNQFTLVGATVNSGNIVINQGTFSIEAATALNPDATSSVVVNDGATLQFFTLTGTVAWPITLTGNTTLREDSGAGVTSTVASNVTIAGNATFTTSTTSTLALTGLVSGPASNLIVVGPGTLSLQNATNTYGGGTTLNGGTLNFLDIASLSSGPLTFNGGTLQYTSGNTDDVSSLGITLNTNGGTIDTNGSNVAFAHAMTGGGGFTKEGAGTLTFNAFNTYAGSTGVANGTLVLATLPSSFTTGAGLVFGDANNNAGTLDLDGHSVTVTSISSIGTSSGHQITNNPSTTTSVTVTFAGTPNVQNIYNGGFQDGNGVMTLNVTSGWLTLGGTSNMSGPITISHGAILQFGEDNTSFSGDPGNSAITDNGTLILDRGDNHTFSNAITGSGNVISEGDPINTINELNNTNHYTGGTTFAGGLLGITSDAGINNGVGGMAFTGGGLLFDNYTSSLSFTSANTTGNLTLGANGTSTLNGNINLPGNFTFAGPGALILAGSVSYTGSTTIERGTLSLGAAASLPTGTALTMGDSNNDSPTLDLDGHNVTLSGLNSLGAGTSTIGSSSSTQNTTITFTGSVASTFAGNIADSVNGGSGHTTSLTVTAGSLTLTAGNSYTGNTTVSGGSLIMGANGTLTSTNITVGPAGTLTTLVNGNIPTNTALVANGIVNFSNPTTTIATLNSTSPGTINLNADELTASNGGSFVGTIQDNATGGELFVPSGTTLTTGAVNVTTLETDGTHVIRNNPSTPAVSKISTLIIPGSYGGTASAPSVWTGALDLTNSKLIIEDSTVNRAADLAEIKDQALAANTTGNVGIYSSTANAFNVAAGKIVKVVAVVDNGVRMATFPSGSTNFGGVNNVDANSILITAAFKGDANLDGVVDIQDLTVVANHWQQTVTDWSQGDFDGSDFVDIQDLTAVANNWQAGVGSGGGSGSTNSLSILAAFGVTTATPEPASLALLTLGGLVLASRRRNRA